MRFRRERRFLVVSGLIHNGLRPSTRPPVLDLGGGLAKQRDPLIGKRAAQAQRNARAQKRLVRERGKTTSLTVSLACTFADDYESTGQRSALGIPLLNGSREGRGSIAGKKKHRTSVSRR